MAAFPPPPVAITHEISATCPSHRCPLVTTNKVVLSVQHFSFYICDSEIQLCIAHSVGNIS